MSKRKKLELEPVQIYYVAHENFKKLYVDHRGEKPILINQLVLSILVKGNIIYFSDFFTDVFALAKRKESALIRCFEEIEDHFIGICITFKGSIEGLGTQNEAAEIEGFSLAHHRNNFAETESEIHIYSKNLNEITIQLKCPIELVAFAS